MGLADLETAEDADEESDADDARQDKTVGGVPGGRPPLDGRAGIGVVETGEGKELAGQGPLDRQHGGGPSNDGRQQTQAVAEAGARR